MTKENLTITKFEIRLVRVLQLILTFLIIIGCIAIADNPCHCCILGIATFGAVIKYMIDKCKRNRHKPSAH